VVVALGDFSGGTPRSAVTETSSKDAAAAVVSSPTRPLASRVAPLPTDVPSTYPVTVPPATSTRSVCQPFAADASGTLPSTVTADPRTSSSRAAPGASTSRSNWCAPPARAAIPAAAPLPVSASALTLAVTV
jgi:hypothetical protein